MDKQTLQRYRARLQEKSQAASQQLLGGTCLGCGGHSSLTICETCAGKIAKPEHCCETCGQVLIGQSLALRCRECLQKPSAIEAMDFFANYEGLVAELMVSAKLGRRVEAIAGLQQLLRHHLMAYGGINRHPESSPLARYWQSDYVLLPMPIPKMRLMHRGFNLPLLFAKTLSRQFNLPILGASAVTLPVKTRKQGQLSRRERLKNHRIYQFNHKLPTQIVLIDDIYTTGQSVKSLAYQLRQNGVKSVAVWVFSRGLNS